MEKKPDMPCLPEDPAALSTCFVLDGSDEVPLSGLWVLSDEPGDTEKSQK